MHFYLMGWRVRKGDMQDAGGSVKDEGTIMDDPDHGQRLK